MAANRKRNDLESHATAKPKDSFLWDDHVPQLAARRRGQSHTWIVQTRSDGKTVRTKIGDVAEMPVTIARATALSMLDAARSTGAELDPEISLSKFADRFLTDCQHQWKPSTLKAHGKCVMGQIVPALGRISIAAFSFATIMEFITKPDTTNRPERVRRGQLVKNICGPNAFPYVSDLARGATFPNGGKWMFSSHDNIVSAKSFKRDMHKALTDELAKVEGLNRQQRREFGRKTSLVDLMRNNGSTWGRNRSDYGNFPVSDEIVESRILERFMKGQCSDAEFEMRMNAWLSDPAEFSRIAYDYADKPNMIESTFGKSTDEIERIVQTIQDAAASFQTLHETQLRTRASLVEAGMNKSEARKLTKKISPPEPDLDKPNEKLETALGKGRVGHFNHYLAQAMKPGYTFKRSDVMDVMQMCYAYDCDLFRCDKAMANIFRDFEPFKGKLVGRFAELPDRIAARIAQ